MQIVIRPSQSSDIDDILEMFSQPQAQSQTLQLPNPSRALWESRLGDVPAGVYSYVAEVEGKVVGQLGFEHNQRPRKLHCATFGIAVHDNYHGLGIGSKLIETVIDLADNWLQVKRIEIDVNADNERAIQCYQKFGFEVEGTAKGASFRDGQHIDILYMARLNF